MDTNSLGERIRLIRKELGLTMEEFGKKFIPPADKSNVSRWEKNNAIPSNDRLKRIAELGNISVQQLLYGDERYYLAPLIINIAKKYYDWDISKDPDMVNHIFNRLDEYSYNDDESSLLENNKDIFDKILLYPWEWNSEGLLQFSATRIFELRNELQDIIDYNIDSFDPEAQKDILNTLEKIKGIFSNTKDQIESIPIDEKYSSAAMLEKEIMENANKEILDPKHD